jgi:glutamate dehydrogenase/leucine dehydrogenase
VNKLGPGDPTLHLQFLSHAILFALMLIATFIDFDEQTIPDEVTILIQGFGAVGAHSARILHDRLPAAKVIGISDADGYLYDPSGLPLDELFQRWRTSSAPFLLTRCPLAGWL